MAVSEIIRYVLVTLVVSFGIYMPVLICKGYHLFYRGPDKEINYKREAAFILFYFYIICLFEITAFRFGGIGWDYEQMLNRQTRVNLIPIAALWNWYVKGIWWHLFYNVVGNCVWFVPLGFILPRLLPRYRRLTATVKIGAILSIAIETSQFILCTGVTDIDDVIFNVLGTAVGYGMWKALMLIKTRKSVLQG